jgi:two-component system, OmpR family, sensor histidine kinase ChvG
MLMRSLTTRLLFFNVLLVFFPVGGMLVLDTYEKQLLNSMERSMVQQGRILSASLSGRELREESLRILKNLQARQDSRIRVVNAWGELLADSSDPRLYGELFDLSEKTEGEFRKLSRERSSVLYDEIVESAPESLRDHWLYQAAVYPLNLFRGLFLPPSAPLGSAEYYSGATVLDGPEIRAALEGRYGAWTRYSSGGQRSVNLYSALPVWRDGEVAGAVLISRSTYRILTDLYSLRLDMVRIFLFSLAAAAALSLLLARTITIPVKKLKNQAESFLDHRGRLAGQFKQLKNRDEIGDLSRSLYSLSGKLEKHISFISGFAADVSHELKNPVAAIRSAAELAEQEGGEEMLPFFQLIKRETDRIQRFLEDLQDISRMDVTLDTEEKQVIRLRDFLENCAVEWDQKLEEKRIRILFSDRTAANEDLRVEVSGHRLYQCLSNLLNNAASFSPEGSAVSILLLRSGSMAVLEVLDQGPGIPAGSEELLFNRFYTDRDGGSKGLHTGLGLSIVRSIAEGYGGKISASNRPEGGARFRLELPVFP